jgi:hypothetical protein
VTSADLPVPGVRNTDWGHANFQVGKNFLSNVNAARPSAVPAF